jgi:hypothetical protein
VTWEFVKRDVHHLNAHREKLILCPRNPAIGELIAKHKRSRKAYLNWQRKAERPVNMRLEK